MEALLLQNVRPGIERVDYTNLRLQLYQPYKTFNGVHIFLESTIEWRKIPRHNGCFQLRNVYATFTALIGRECYLLFTPRPVACSSSFCLRFVHSVLYGTVL